MNKKNKVCGCGKPMWCKSKMCIDCRRKNPIRFSEEQRLDISNRLKGRKLSEEHRKHLSESHKNPSPEIRKKMVNRSIGKKLSEETRIKMSLKRTGFKHSVESKLKMSFIQSHKSLETKEKIKEARAKQILPKKDTSIEVKIQDYLKRLGVAFFTHQYIQDIEHGYQCDILVPAMDLIIECDGDYWHKYPMGREIDHIRTSELIKKGFKVLRLWEHEINAMSIDDFKIKIDNYKVAK